MCFLKTLKPLDQIQFEKDAATDESASFQVTNDEPQSSFLNKLLASKTPLLLTKQDILLQNLMRMIDSNNMFLQNIRHKLHLNEQTLINSHHSLNQLPETQNKSSSMLQTQHLQIGKNLFDGDLSTVHPLQTKLFGAQKYNYKLQLQEPIAPIIYKERNITISVNLVDKQSDRVLNSNIVHLCLGVCDSNGNWITENKAGENFMKGKTQVEMYHGEAAFIKVYPRDVSRGYIDGKINFVVYSKPSMIKFTNNSSSVEKMVDSSQIEPLFINDIIVRAKKN